jgi:protein-tyrosine phosphatase
MAEGVMKKLLVDRHILNFMVDSAGIGGWHEGELPDYRAIRTARLHGIDITDQRARQVTTSDLEHFDHILVMDQENMRDTRKLAPVTVHEKIKLLLDFKYPGRGMIVPDPYYSNRFEESYKLIYEGCQAFIDQLTPPASFQS